MTAPARNPWRALPPGPIIAPSLLAADFMRVGEQIEAAVAAGADVLHVDIMDGHFVPNLSMGPDFVRSARAFTDRPLDVHIMVTDAGYFAERFVEAGADSVTFHIEACDARGRHNLSGADPDAAEKAREIIDALHARGLGAGISLRPGTAAEAIEPVADAVDMVLVMTVEPGYGGQKFMDEQLPKIRRIRSMLRDGQRLEVDGGINVETARRCAEAGADVFVAGVNVFRSGDIPAAVAALKSAAGR